MTLTNRTAAAATTTTNGRMTCADILATLSDDSRMALEKWCRLVNLGSTHLGGRGRTREQILAEARAWDALPTAAQSAYFSLLDSVVFELADAIRAVGVPEAERPIDAVEALLGPDHPALRALPAYSLADAYEEAMEQIVVSELADAIRAVGVPETEREIDAVEALLGPDHPALRILPAYALADAFREALKSVAE